MPFASIFGHDSSKNFAYCIANMQKNFMDPLLQPLNFNVQLLGDITSGLTDNLDSNRDFMSKFRESASLTFMKEEPDEFCQLFLPFLYFLLFLLGFYCPLLNLRIMVKVYFLLLFLVLIFFSGLRADILVLELI